MSMDAMLMRLMDRLDRLERIQERGVFEVPRTKIAEVSGTGSSGVLEFASIPATYRSLEIILHGKGTAAGGFLSCYVTFEASPTNGAYAYMRTLGYAGAALSQENNFADEYIFGGAFPGSTDGYLHGSARILLPEYTNPYSTRDVLVHGCSVGSTGSGGITPEMTAGVWYSSAAIDLVRLTIQSGSWTTTTRATLYGIPG